MFEYEKPALVLSWLFWLLIFLAGATWETKHYWSLGFIILAHITFVAWLIAKAYQNNQWNK